MGRNSDARNATKALADFYRVALSKGSEIITIGEEIKNVKAYLYLQSVRYSDVFDFEIDIQESIQDFCILKLTIQPLVENSIYHGLTHKGSFGHIFVKGFREDDNIAIEVIDDGVGIPDDKLSEILEFDQSLASRDSFGLASVNERIKLYYGEGYGVKISSRIGQGTEVKVVIPVFDRRQVDNV
jgi:two-component system sensor histidine kinase YesM